MMWTLEYGHGNRDIVCIQLQCTVKQTPFESVSHRNFIRLYLPALNLVGMSSLLNISRRGVIPGYRRYLATTPSTTRTTSPLPDFRTSLDNGPSFHDFISGESSERVVLGNTKG